MLFSGCEPGEDGGFAACKFPVDVGWSCTADAGYDCRVGVSEPQGRATWSSRTLERVVHTGCVSEPGDSPTHHVVQKPRRKTDQVAVADFTMTVRVPGRVAATRVFTDAEADDAATYAVGVPQIAASSPQATIRSSMSHWLKRFDLHAVLPVPTNNRDC